MEPSLHVSLNVSDAARSRDFYAAFFGVEPATLIMGHDPDRADRFPRDVKGNQQSFFQ